MATLLEKAKANLTIVKFRFTLTEVNRNGKRGTETPNLWEKYGKAILYVPTNAWRGDCEKIDLITGEVTGETAQTVLDFINSL